MTSPQLVTVVCVLGTHCSQALPQTAPSPHPMASGMPCLWFFFNHPSLTPQHTHTQMCTHTESDPRAKQSIYLCALPRSSLISGLVCLLCPCVCVCLSGFPLGWSGIVGVGFEEGHRLTGCWNIDSEEQGHRVPVPWTPGDFSCGRGPMGQWRVHRTDSGESQPQAFREQLRFRWRRLQCWPPENFPEGAPSPHSPPPSTSWPGAVGLCYFYVV